MDVLLSRFTKRTLHAGVLTGSMLTAFFIAFIYNAFLGRVLSFSDFGVITFIGSLWLIIGVFCNALGLTINRMVVHATKVGGESRGIALFQHIRKKALQVALICFALTVALSMQISNAFSLHSPTTVILIATLFLTGILAASNRGYLQSKFQFSKVGITLVAESAIKFFLAFLFVLFFPWEYVYLSIPISAFITYILSEYLLPREISSQQKYSSKFPLHFYIASVLTVLSTMLLLTSDVILAKLFLTPIVAGQYSFLSLIGKMIYFFGSILCIIMVPYISEKIAHGGNDIPIFYKFLLGNGFLILLVYFSVGIFGSITLPLLLGGKVQQVSQYLLSYSTAIALITLSNIFVVYNLLHHRYIFPFIALLISILIITTMLFFHANIAVMVRILFSYSILLIATIVFLHTNQPARLLLELRMPFLKAAYEK